jgi:hypothetical protein
MAEVETNPELFLAGWRPGEMYEFHCLENFDATANT